MSEKIKLNLIIALTILFWASAYVGIRAGLKGYSPGSLALLRFLIASFCMLIVFYKNKVKQKLSYQQIGQTILLGIIGITVYHVFLNYGEITVQAGIACFIISQVPVLITIFAIFFLGERLKLNGWIGTAISIAGLIVIALNNKINAHFNIGIIYICVAAIASALYTVFQKSLLRNMHPLTFTSYMTWAGTACLLFFLPNLIKELPHAPIAATLSVVYIGIFPAAVANLLWSYALKQQHASKLGSTLYIAPLGTMLMGWIFLGEVPTILALSGGLLALFGAYLVSQGVRVSGCQSKTTQK